MGILAWKRSNELSSCLAYLTSSDFSSFSLSLTERNIAKGTADPRVSALTKVIAFKPYRSTQLVYSIKFKLSHAIDLPAVQVKASDRDGSSPNNNLVYRIQAGAKDKFVIRCVESLQ